jgi:hypothetical protein
MQKWGLVAYLKHELQGKRTHPVSQAPHLGS